MKQIYCFILLMFLGCATGEQIKNVSPGMSKNEVISLLGKPDSYKKMGDVEVYSYTNRLISGWSHDRADYHVVIENGVVSQYGAGEVRVKEGPTQTIIIAPIP